MAEAEVNISPYELREFSSLCVAKPKALELDILFEDDDVLVLNKSPGVVVHPGAGETGVTLVEGVMYHLGNEGAAKLAGPADRPGVVHRLDKDTSGAMVFAKNAASLDTLKAQFAKRSNFRAYLALLDGAMPRAEWRVESYLRRDPKSRMRYASSSLNAEEAKLAPGHRLAVSHFKRLAVFAGKLSLCAVRLETGRTHQIRVHARDTQHPVFGDPLYGRPLANSLHWTVFPEEVRQRFKSLTRQMLHAQFLGFTHPRSQEKMRFEAALPADFAELLQDLLPYADPTI